MNLKMIGHVFLGPGVNLANEGKGGGATAVTPPVSVGVSRVLLGKRRREGGEGVDICRSRCLEKCMLGRI